MNQWEEWKPQRHLVNIPHPTSSRNKATEISCREPEGTGQSCPVQVGEGYICLRCSFIHSGSSLITPSFHFVRSSSLSQTTDASLLPPWAPRGQPPLLPSVLRRNESAQSLTSRAPSSQSNWHEGTKAGRSLRCDPLKNHCVFCGGKA